MASTDTSIKRQQIDEPESRTVKPIVSVIVPHYNDLENLRECLKSLRAQTMSQSQYEIIVSDNNSTCGLAAVMEACEGTARVVSAIKQGAAEARNVGVSVALGEVLAFIDSDCRPAPEWLESGVRALDDADIAGGRMIVVVEDPRRLTYAEAYELVFAFNNRRYIEDEGYSITANMFTRQDTFKKVGPFRGGVAEDIDWGRRATGLGFCTRYVENAVVAHPARRQWADLLGKWRRTTSESYALYCERPYGRAWWFARSWLILISPIVHCEKVFRSNALSSFDQRVKAFVGLVRLRTWRFVECNRKLMTL